MVRILGKEVAKFMMETEPIHSTNPLCGAILRGHLDLGKVAVDIGANLEFEGHDLGTALMVASAFGLLEVIRFLVSRGAGIYYTSSRVQVDGQFNSTRSRSAVDLAGRYPHIRRWFLVERYTEQPKLESSERIQPGGAKVRPWSGVRKVEYPLIGTRARQFFESSIAFSRRVDDMKRSLRGQVVHYTKIVD